MPFMAYTTTSPKARILLLERKVQALQVELGTMALQQSEQQMAYQDLKQRNTVLETAHQRLRFKYDKLSEESNWYARRLEEGIRDRSTIDGKMDEVVAIRKQCDQRTLKNMERVCERSVALGLRGESVVGGAVTVDGTMVAGTGDSEAISRRPKKRSRRASSSSSCTLVDMDWGEGSTEEAVYETRSCSQQSDISLLNGSRREGLRPSIREGKMPGTWDFESGFTPEEGKKMPGAWDFKSFI